MELVFIAGLPRSGTTIAAAMLDGHPDILAWPFELRYFTGFWGGIPGGDRKDGRTLKAFARKLTQPFERLEIDQRLSKVGIRGKVDFELFAEAATSIPDNAHFNSVEFLCHLAAAFRSAHKDYQDRNVRYFAVKTMLSGIDWSRPLPGKVIITERSVEECYASSKRKALSRQGQTRRQWYRRDALEILMQIKLFHEVTLKFRGSSNALFLPLDDIQFEDGLVAAQKICRFLDVAASNSMSRPTLLGNEFGGHYLDRRLNSGVFNKGRSQGARLSQAEEFFCRGERPPLSALFAEPLLIVELLKISRECDGAVDLMRRDLTKSRGSLVFNQ